VDRGPGIPDVEKALSLAFRPPNWISQSLVLVPAWALTIFKRCADSMKLESKMGHGTRLEIIDLFAARIRGRLQSTKEESSGVVMIFLKEVVGKAED